MSLKSTISVPYAKWQIAKAQKAIQNPIGAQERWFKTLISKAKNTHFGKDHGFDEDWGFQEYQELVPVRDYEDLKKYTDTMVKGQEDVLWPGKPKYICKTSGTTSGTKYIPISKESMPFHIAAAKNALLSYIAEKGKANFVAGKMIFLQGSPELNMLDSGLLYGRLSGIVAHHVPGYLQRNRLPSFETNCIEDWEEKVAAIVKETAHENMTLIGGIPSWVQMYYEQLLAYTGKSTVAEVFPNLSLFVYGGVNFEPYRARFQQLVGKEIDSIETYPASEGFIAYQDQIGSQDLLLNIDGGIFFEFIKAEEFHQENPRRYTLGEVKKGVNYALIISTNAGLWSYSIGDTVRFTSLLPYRIRVSGRIKHFTSAFGEHVIGEEVETAMSIALEKHGGVISEFHLAPKVQVKEELPYHEWLVEWEQEPNDLSAFAMTIDEEMCKQNVYYKDLIDGNILMQAQIHSLPSGTFRRFMETRGKLGGQNKVPRLSNDRNMADEIIAAKRR